MTTTVVKGGIHVSEPIHVPFNENTKHIYEAYVKVAKEIAERKRAENALADKDAASTI